MNKAKQKAVTNRNYFLLSRNIKFKQPGRVHRIQDIALQAALLRNPDRPQIRHQLGPQRRIPPTGVASDLYPNICRARCQEPPRLCDHHQWTSQPRNHGCRGIPERRRSVRSFLDHVRHLVVFCLFCSSISLDKNSSVLFLPPKK